MRARATSVPAVIFVPGISAMENDTSPARRRRRKSDTSALLASTSSRRLHRLTRWDAVCSGNTTSSAPPSPPIRPGFESSVDERDPSPPRMPQRYGTSGMSDLSLDVDQSARKIPQPAKSLPPRCPRRSPSQKFQVDVRMSSEQSLYSADDVASFTTILLATAA